MCLEHPAKRSPVTLCLGPVPQRSFSLSLNCLAVAANISESFHGHTQWPFVQFLSQLLTSNRFAPHAPESARTGYSHGFRKSGSGHAEMKVSVRQSCTRTQSQGKGVQRKIIIRTTTSTNPAARDNVRSTPGPPGSGSYVDSAKSPPYR